MKVLLSLFLFLVLDTCPRYNETYPHRSYILVLGDTGGDGGAYGSSNSGSSSKANKDILSNSKSNKKTHHHSPPIDYEDYLDELDEEDDDEDLLDEEFNKKLKALKDKSSGAGSSSGSLSHGGDSRSIQTQEICPEQIEGRCHCGHILDHYDKTKKRYVVNCTNAGFINADPLQYIPEETEILIVRGNKMRVLPQNIFGTKREHRKLKEIDLSDNDIEEIKGKAFHHVNEVEILILDYNKISIETLRDHPRLFSNFVSLKSLHLSRAFEPGNEKLMDDLRNVFYHSNLTLLEKLHLELNSIERIEDPNTFCDLRSLMHIYLGQNSLSDLVLNVDCLPYLNYVDLTSNKIRTIRNSTFLLDLMRSRMNQKSEPIRVDVHDNPFHCDCELRAFLNWLQDISKTNPDQIRYRSSMRCSSGVPQNNTHILLSSVTKTECATLRAETNEVMNAVSATLLSLIILATTVLLLGFYFYKNGAPGCIRYCLCPGNAPSPLLMTAQGVKYTSIEKEEAAEVAHV